MKPLSETYKELGIAFSFPIEIMEANDRLTYWENSDDDLASCKNQKQRKELFRKLTKNKYE